MTTPTDGRVIKPGDPAMDSVLEVFGLTTRATVAESLLESERCKYANACANLEAAAKQIEALEEKLKTATAMANRYVTGLESIGKMFDEEPDDGLKNDRAVLNKLLGK